MAIQMRRGRFSNFLPSKLQPGEWAVVQSEDPSASDGKSVYMAFAAGVVKRLATYEDMVDSCRQAIEQSIADIKTKLTERVEATNASITETEKKRVTAETSRAKAEASRVSAESSRSNAEKARASAESSRAKAETSRSDAESKRAKAETARVESFNAVSLNAQLAANSANDAAGKTGAVIKSASDAAEDAKQAAAQARGSIGDTRFWFDYDDMGYLTIYRKVR